MTTLTAAPSLDVLTAIADDAALASIAAEARALSQRLRDGIAYVVCLGQFKRGKSTLLNALIGAPVLPVGVTPVTSVITVVRYGETPAVTVRFVSGAVEVIPTDALGRYVTEDGNHENRLGVTSVEIAWPSSLLGSGVCLVDTPGISSVFAGNTQVTLDFVPNIDAAIVVVGADPPISHDELSLIQAVAALTPALIVVSNKTDRVSADDAEQARTFAERQLAEHLGRHMPVWTVSAAERIATGTATRQWPQLESALSEIGGHTAELLRQGEARGARRLAGRLRRILTERLRALTEPIEASRQRIADLRRGLSEASRLLVEMDVLLGMDVDAVTRTFEADQAARLESQRAAALDELRRAIGEATGSARARRNAAFRAARDIAQHGITEWRLAAQPQVDHAYREVVTSLARRATECLARIRQSHFTTAADVPPEVIAPEGLTTPSHFYPTDLMPLTASGPVTALLDFVLPQHAVASRVFGRASHYLSRVLETNGSRAVNDFRERLTESRRAFQREVRASLERMVTAAEQGVALAAAQHSLGQQAVVAERARVARWLAQIEHLGE